MKKLLVAGVVLSAVASGAAFAGDKVEVVWGAGAKRFDVGQVETMSVCSLKAMVAGEFGLQARKFDLMKGGRKLNDGKTLAGDHIYANHKLLVKEVSYSNQC
ncbi:MULTISPECIES: ubiquitin-like domain-containing protein [Kordiimonas]|uniref:ubiquitin-like domain-containing protein n=1 Tax=Kordiimonas TaxID=288021 RepID=UPI00257DA6B2|nr:ubiquitin-like domain-containing protein [Kordiimonas sp. UBA4487]